MTDLVIVNPSASHGVYGPLGDKLIAVEPPLWPRLIAAYIRDSGFSVAIIDAEAERLTPDEIADRVAGLAPRLVCVCVFGHQPSASTQQMFGARECLELLPAHIDTIIVGGHVSALPERTLSEERVDYACKGEGPRTILGLLRNEPEETIPGLVWVRPGDENDATAICVNPEAPLLTTEELNGDAWDLLPMDRYVAHNWQCFGDLPSRQPYAAIYTTLGCPFKCGFCCINAPFNSNAYRMRKPEDVVREIIMLHEGYGVSTFKIIDEMFVLNERHYTAICNGIIEAGLGDKLNFWAYARIDTVKPKTLALLRKAGIRWLALGIESGSEYVRDGAEKALKTNDIVGIVEKIRAADINVIGNYIFGLRDDTMASMNETLALAMELNTEFANFYSCMAYPGSKLYTQALEHGWALPAEWRGYSQHNTECRPLDTEHLTAKQVLAFRDAAFTRYFTNPAYLGMVEKKFGPETTAHVRDMTKYQLKRKLLTGEIV